MRSLNELVRKRVEELGISQSEFARGIGAQPYQVNKWLTAGDRIPLSRLRSISEYLGIRLDEIVEHLEESQLPKAALTLIDPPVLGRLVHAIGCLKPEEQAAVIEALGLAEDS